MSVLQVLVNLEGEVIAEGTEVLWGIVFLLLTILWCYYDSDRDGFKRPFDFDLIVYLFWPFALPWCLLFTYAEAGWSADIPGVHFSVAWSLAAGANHSRLPVLSHPPG